MCDAAAGSCERFVLFAHTELPAVGSNRILAGGYRRRACGRVASAALKVGLAAPYIRVRDAVFCSEIIDKVISVENTNERSRVGANAMRNFHGLFVQLGAWRSL